MFWEQELKKFDKAISYRHDLYESAFPQVTVRFRYEFGQPLLIAAQTFEHAVIAQAIHRTHDCLGIFGQGKEILTKFLTLRSARIVIAVKTNDGYVESEL